MSDELNAKSIVSEYTLNESEIKEINNLLNDICLQYDTSESQELYRELNVLAAELPKTLRKFVNQYKMEETSGCLLVKGYPVDDEQIGLTPSHWNDRKLPSPTHKQEILFALVGTLLGQPFGWETQQNGYLIHDILPISGHENEQISSGSEELIWWHIEDAFHPYRPDYVGLMCLRNHDNVPTTYVSFDQLELSPKDIEVLSKPHYIIRPDNSHLGNFNNKEDVNYSFIEELMHTPPNVPILFGDPKEPYIRLDPYFMDEPEDPEAKSAFQALINEIDKKIMDVALQPGDICFVDNYKAVHGRKPFYAKYDGKDRWLKRICVTRDLRKSRDRREEAASPIIF